mgnify:CR=1 FL=1
MNKRQVARLEPGIYRVDWKDGGNSLAAVGVTSDGHRWLAPANWVAPNTTGRDVWHLVEDVGFLHYGRVHNEAGEGGRH